MTTAINMFLRTTIRENVIPFELKLGVPNDVTLAAIKEGKELLNDSNTKKYSSIDELKAALEDEI